MEKRLLFQIADQAIPPIQAFFGSRLISVYALNRFFASYRRQRPDDVHLLFIVHELPDLSQLRALLQRTLFPAIEPLEVSIAVAEQNALRRHLTLQPLLAEELMNNAILLTGTPQVEWPRGLERLDSMARLAGQAMVASACVAPALLPPREHLDLSVRLRELATSVGLRPGNGAGMDLVGLLATIEAHLAAQVQNLSKYQWRATVAHPAPPLIPELVAVYEWDHGLILVLPDHSPDRLADLIKTIDWASVSSRVAEQYRSIRLSTPSQLRLIVERETPADFVLRSYQHAWGSDVLSGVTIEEWLTLRDLARLPSEMQIALVPQAYAAAHEDDLAMLVHDLQNKLLNIQLRDELYRRLKGSAAVKPPKALPDRLADPRERINGIMEYCSWWAEQYAQEMILAAPPPG